MLEFWLIRHGMTEGNRYGRYIGVTDEPLCEKGREFLQNMSYPAPQAVYISPLVRCRETARILFPDHSLHTVEELAECDFGDFENKNYQELAGNPDYQEWIESGGMLPFQTGRAGRRFGGGISRGFRRRRQDASGMGYLERLL